MESLRKLPTVGMSAADGRASWHLLGPRGAAFELQHRPVYTADDLIALKSAALQGTGISVLPDYLCSEELRRGELVPVLPGWAPPVAMVLAVFPSRRGMVPAVRTRSPGPWCVEATPDTERHQRAALRFRAARPQPA